jgi:hypothetical protein
METNALGRNPTSLVIADFNQDGRLDVAVTNFGEGTVTVLLNLGAGRLGSASKLSVGYGPALLSATDLNQDGAIDLVVANQLDQTLGVLLGHGDGTFEAQVAFDTQWIPMGLCAGDLNGDGRPDLAVSFQKSASTGSLDSVLAVLLNDGDGGFPTYAIYDQSGNLPETLIEASFAGAATHDLALTEGAGGLQVFRGVGDGSFVGEPTLAPTQKSTSVSAADFNRDGNVDLAVAVSGSINVYLNPGSGLFSDPPGVNATSGNALGIAAGDVNCDGTADLLAAEANGTLGIFLGEGNGSFQPEMARPVARALSVVTVADIDGDGRPDVVAIDASQNVLLTLLSRCQTK